MKSLRTAPVIDLVQKTNKLLMFRQTVTLSPDQWHSFKTPVKLTWDKVRFTKANVAKVPDERGIYAFVVRFVRDMGQKPLGMPPHGYIMYVGITGHVSTKRSLRERYKDYLRERTRVKRARVCMMLNTWPQDLFFYFSHVAKGSDLKVIETKMLDAIIPPFNVGDLSAEMRPRVAAMRARS